MTLMTWSTFTPTRTWTKAASVALVCSLNLLIWPAPVSLADSDLPAEEPIQVVDEPEVNADLPEPVLPDELDLPEENAEPETPAETDPELEFDPEEEDLPVVEPLKLGDFQLVKLQLRDKTCPQEGFCNSQELIVVKNTTDKVLNLKGWRLVHENLSGKVQLNFEIKTDYWLNPNQQAYFINGYLDVVYTNNLEPEKLLEFAKAKNGRLLKSGGVIKLVTNDEIEVLQINYSNKSNENSLLLSADFDFVSQVVGTDGQVVNDANGQPVYQQFLARQPQPVVWLTIEVLPLAPLPPEPEDPDPTPEPDPTPNPQPNPDTPLPDQPTCQTGYEIGFTGTCVKVCGNGYERNPLTNRCRKVTEDEDEGPKPCPDGYERNPLTNRCRKIVEEENGLKPCPAGYYRNPETNRCRKIETTLATALQPCPPGYERNPATNRCRKVTTSCQDGYEIGPNGTCVKSCGDGYERNPETGRCRKIAQVALAEGEVEAKLEERPEDQKSDDFGLVLTGAAIVAAVGAAAGIRQKFFK